MNIVLYCQNVRFCVVLNIITLIFSHPFSYQIKIRNGIKPFAHIFKFIFHLVITQYVAPKLIKKVMTIRRLLSKSYSLYRSSIDNAFSPKNLFYTNVLLSIGISTTGDLLEQCYEWHVKDIDKIDTHRTAHMAFSGCTTGIICHHWYNFLDGIIIGRSYDMVIKKLLLDQFICSPIVILSFFATVAIFEDNPLQNFNDEVKEKFWTLYKAEWVVWPPAQIINFYFLPTKYRVAYDNTISLGYDIYTSHVKHHKPRKEHDKNETDRND